LDEIKSLLKELLNGTWRYSTRFYG
jgi:hypothetical protein